MSNSIFENQLKFWQWIVKLAHILHWYMHIIVTNDILNLHQSKSLNVYILFCDSLKEHDKTFTCNLSFMDEIHLSPSISHQFIEECGKKVR